MGEHCVWLELAEKYCSNNASVARCTTPLTARSIDELRAFVVERARLDRYWIAETTFTNPLPRFKLPGSDPLLSCELLPGGEYLILVHRNGDISLLSLVDLDNTHEIAKFPIGSYSGHAHTTSLTMDHKGRPLVAVCIYGSPRRYTHALDCCCLADRPTNSRVILATPEIETKSIRLVRCLELELSTLAIAVQRDTLACLCRHDAYTEQNAFSFVITTVDEHTANKVLRISRIPADPQVSVAQDTLRTVWRRTACLPQPHRLFISPTFAYPPQRPSSSSNHLASDVTTSRIYQSYRLVTTSSLDYHPFGLGKAPHSQRFI